MNIPSSSRRSFVRKSAFAAAALTLPTIVPAKVLGTPRLSLTSEQHVLRDALDAVVSGV